MKFERKAITNPQKITVLKRPIYEVTPTINNNTFTTP